MVPAGVIGGQTLPQFAPSIEAGYSDVWRSVDGRRWEMVADGLAWGPRAAIVGSAVLHDRMWLIVSSRGKAAAD